MSICADEPSIFMVAVVVDGQTQMAALAWCGLYALTLHIFQEDVSHTATPHPCNKVAIPWGDQRPPHSPAVGTPCGQR